MQWNLQPTIEGHLIRVRPLCIDDFHALYRGASDPQIWAQHPEPDRYKPEVFQRFFDGAIQSKGAFAVIDRHSGRIIGSSRFYAYNPQARQLAIGYTFLE